MCENEEGEYGLDRSMVWPDQNETMEAGPTPKGVDQSTVPQVSADDHTGGE